MLPTTFVYPWTSSASAVWILVTALYSREIVSNPLNETVCSPRVMLDRGVSTTAVPHAATCVVSKAREAGIVAMRTQGGGAHLLQGGDLIPVDGALLDAYAQVGRQLEDHRLGARRQDRLRGGRDERAVGGDTEEVGR